MAGNGIEKQKPQSLEAIVAESANQRAEYSRNFLAKKGISMPTFLENLKKAPWSINIAPNDNKSLALGILALQKKLGFKQLDTTEGCDGKLGGYTWKKFQEYQLKGKSRRALSALRMETTSIPTVKPTASPKPPKVDSSSTTDVAKSSPEVYGEKVALNQTIFVGDSITAGMKNSGSIDGAQECFKGGMQTGWMLKNFKERFFDKDDRGEFQLKPEFRNGAVKKIVIEGGFNDITSLKSLEYVKKNLTEMYSLARKAGLTIVACTYPEWDAVKGVEIFQRDFKKHGWGTPPGTYPLSPDELQSRTQELRQWILSQNNPAKGFTAVDLYTEMHDRQKYPRADFVHPSGKGSKAMASYIKNQGGIKESDK